eukprot:TRINITY_DN25745_c0_g1_i1.p1 TRINITY_DN25745_c0_g1~~TRINITY_DN25745_c0_g1_i1.p1  ORF type:complete len:361 (-),score=-50.26 TRINITY_DN25745_c0_g1_i1:349-1431(-)
MGSKLQKKDFMGKDVFVGIDMHKTNWYITILIDSLKVKKTFIPDAVQLVEYMRKHYPGANYHAVYETGYFGFTHVRTMLKMGVDAIVCNPGDIPMGNKNKAYKTDAKDSETLANSLRAGLLSSIYIPTENEQALRELVRLRQTIVNDRKRIINQIKGFLTSYNVELPEEYKSASGSSQKFLDGLSKITFIHNELNIVLSYHIKRLKFVNEEIKNIQRQMKELDDSDPHMKEQLSIVLSAPGMGSILSRIYLYEIMDIKRFKDRDSYLSFIGLCPTEHSSGDKRRMGRMTKRCNSELRRVLIEAAWVAIRYDKELKEYYETNKIKVNSKYAIIKTAKKLASKLRYILLHNIKYNRDKKCAA